MNIDTNFFGQAFPLQVTLAWTDPPGNPAAAIKLVNNLDPVSYTHLDVYKRQASGGADSAARCPYRCL